MVWRLTIRSFFALKCVKQMQCTTQNLKSLLIKQREILNKQSLVAVVNKSFSTNTKFHQRAEKLQENREPVSSDGYLKSAIKGTYLNDKRDLLAVNFGEAEDLEYPVVWLRDNCQCHECFDPISNSRVHPRLSFTSDITPEAISSNEESVSIKWGDGHLSNFNKEWLCNHSFNPYHQMERLRKRNFQRTPWNAKQFIDNLQNICYSYDEVIKEDKTLLKWLETLATVGVAKLTGAPLEKGQVFDLAKRISYIRKTHYGEEYYIKGDDGANNVAYKKGALQMHTDMPYYQYMPGVVLLHFVMQSPEGGENVLTDGLNVVQHLPRRMYDILSKTIVDWIDIGFENDHKFHSIYPAPVICEDTFGNLERVNWSQPQRDSVFNVSPQRALEWYEAFVEFSRILHDPKHAAVIKNSEGDILAFDNRRVVHGRLDYTDGKRLLCGAFLDWDEIYSKIRVLRRDLNK